MAHFFSDHEHVSALQLDLGRNGGPVGRYPAAQFEPATSPSAQRNSEALRSPNQTQPGPPKKRGRKSCSQLSKSSCTFCDFYGGPRNNGALCSPKQTQSGPALTNVGQVRPRNNVANRAVSLVNLLAHFAISMEAQETTRLHGHPSRPSPGQYQRTWAESAQETTRLCVHPS